MLTSPPKLQLKELKQPAKRVINSPVISLESGGNCDDRDLTRAVTLSRESKGTPVVGRKIFLRDEHHLKSQASQEFEEFVKTTSLSSLSISRDVHSPPSNEGRSVKNVEIVDSGQKQKQSVGSNTDLERGILKLISTDAKVDSSENENKASPTYVNRRRPQTPLSGTLMNVSFEAPLVSSGADVALKTRRTEKSVNTKSGYAQVLLSTSLDGQDTSGIYDRKSEKCPVASPRRRKPSLHSLDVVSTSQNNEADEVTLSGFYTPREDDNTLTDTPRSMLMPHRKAIEIVGNRIAQSVSTEFKLQSSIPNLGTLNDSTDKLGSVKPVVSTPTRPSRKVDLKITGSAVPVQNVGNWQTLHVDDVRNADTQGRLLLDQSKPRSTQNWAEFKDSPRKVAHLDDFDDFHGQGVTYTHAKREAIPERHSSINIADGRRTSLSNTIEYSDDFDSAPASWATKLSTSPRHSKLTKSVELRDGKHRVSWPDQSGFLAETRSQSVDLSQSFDEVTIEDLESYSEQFDSTALTPRTAEWSRSQSAMRSLVEADEASMTTQTPVTSLYSSVRTSIPTSMRTHITTAPVDDRPSRTSQLYSESFESTGVVSHTSSGLQRSNSLTYSEAWDSDVSDMSSPRMSSPRISSRHQTKLGLSKLEESGSEDDYTMSFTQSTTRQKTVHEESVVERRATADALDSFLRSKMKLMRNRRKPPAPAGAHTEKKEPKLVGEDAKALKSFVKQKFSLLKSRSQQEVTENETHCEPSASCQLRGLSGGNTETTAAAESEHIDVLIGRLKANNTIANLQQAARAKLHQPHKCKHCRQKMEALASERFMWHKKALVSEKLVQEKMEMHLLQLQDPMWLYAEALRGLPKVSDNRDDVYYRLMRPLFDTYAGRYQESLAPCLSQHSDLM